MPGTEVRKRSEPRSSDGKKKSLQLIFWVADLDPVPGAAAIGANPAPQQAPQQPQQPQQPPQPQPNPYVPQITTTSTNWENQGVCLCTPAVKCVKAAPLPRACTGSGRRWPRAGRTAGAGHSSAPTALDSLTSASSTRYLPFIHVLTRETKNPFSSPIDV